MTALDDASATRLPWHLRGNYAPVFEEVDAALGQKLSSLMWEGPEADLTLTDDEIAARYGELALVSGAAADAAAVGVSYAVLTAPFDGIVEELNAVAGTQVSEGALLVKVARSEA